RFNKSVHTSRSKGLESEN
ncbi:hypothetical protein TSUD_67570, partial [Trifolium subterraneum]